MNKIDLASKSYIYSCSTYYDDIAYQSTINIYLVVPRILTCIFDSLEWYSGKAQSKTVYLHILKTHSFNKCSTKSEILEFIRKYLMTKRIAQNNVNDHYMLLQ